MESRCGSGETETGGEVKDFNETYREIALNCFRYLDFKSFEEVDRLTIPEYELLMEAVQLKWVDADYRNHLQAFLRVEVKPLSVADSMAFTEYDSAIISLSL